MSYGWGRRGAFESLVARREEIGPQQISSVLGWNIGLGKGEVDSSIESASDAWGPMQNWLLKLRRRGVSVLFVHHAGTNGRQRGTSRREDVLDTVIALRRPENYSPDQGGRFEVHFESSGTGSAN
jgi:hypothetical protein